MFPDYKQGGSMFAFPDDSKLLSNFGKKTENDQHGHPNTQSFVRDISPPLVL